MSPVIRKRNNVKSRRWSKQSVSWWKIWSRTFVVRGRSEVANHFLLCNGATQVPRTVPAESRNAKEALPRNHWRGCQCWMRSESWPNLIEWYQRQTAMLFTASSRHKPEQTREGQKSATQQQRTKVLPSTTNFYLDQTCCRVWLELFFASENCN